MSRLDSVLPNNLKISEAPNLEELERDAEARGISLRERMCLELKEQYKAISGEGTRGETVWLCMNPAIMSYQCWLGKRVIKRLLPKQVAVGREVTRMAVKNDLWG